MSIGQLTDFMKHISTEDAQLATEPTTQSGKDLAKAFSELKEVDGEEKVQGVIKKISAFAKHKGFDVSEEDVKQYIDGLKLQYEINPLVASMMDQYCSTTCHIGSAVSAS